MSCPSSRPSNRYPARFAANDDDGSAIKARTQAANQIRDLIVTASDQLRSRLRGLDTDRRVAVCARFRTGDVTDPGEATKLALRTLARRHQELSAAIDELDTQISQLCAAINPALLAARGVGPEVAATLLATAGDNPDRMGSEAAFAALCGAGPVEASSAKVTRHRLNSGGDRQANNALWRIVLVRMSSDPRTKAYVARRTLEGKSKKEIIRCLKRHVAREIFRLLSKPASVPVGRATNCTPERQHHPCRRRRSVRHLAHPPLRTRTRRRPRCRTRPPLPALAPARTSRLTSYGL